LNVISELDRRHFHESVKSVNPAGVFAYWQDLGKYKGFWALTFE